MNTAPIIMLLLMSLSMLLGVPASYAQNYKITEAQNVTYNEIGVSTEVTVILVFPAPITEGAIDRGHPDLATSAVPGVKNVLRVKAKSLNMPNTTLTVFTTDGRIYFLKVHVDPAPTQTVYSFAAVTSVPTQAIYDDSRLTESQIAEAAKVLVATAPHQRRPASAKKGGMKARITGVFQKQGVLFFKVHVNNTSAIDYPINLLQCYIRDRTTAKRTAIMEKAVEPLHLAYTPESAVPAGNSIEIVIAVEQFTISDNKYFFIELFEKNGDRPLAIKIRGTDLLRARLF
ncbi:conjugative transposon protein TraN [Chitinophaga arvensicola]|uniref:Bacteroides conjugative transposon TraN protein n=1 Tax=Chitinophaga arvensicola TaxID=29529 RepID=A0A1I0PN34_9BACT|nr:conjugative transposon protein TraN [Chitinophaga arvensicola]SEW15762.1 Bacteroides conjugative transposon TraN protein [Chitinophaga arvensicola]